MICPNPRCRNGWVPTQATLQRAAFMTMKEPCPTCNGCAIGYCCDGDRACPEDEPPRSEKAY